MIELARAPLAPHAHQVVGVSWLTTLVDPPAGRVLPGCYALWDEMGAGKSKQVIDAAQVLFTREEIDRVFIVAPGYIRSLVWFNQELGELGLHLWPDLPSRIVEFHGKMRMWETHPGRVDNLVWIITNYEYIRREEHLNWMIKRANKKTLLVLDESSFVKTYKAQQTIACRKLREHCGRVILLNGTPDSSGNLGDIYSQARIMDPRILGSKGWFQFRARYAIMGGFKNKQIMGWRHLYRPATEETPACCERTPDIERYWNVVHDPHLPNAEEVQRKMAPYVLRRMTDDCLDLPEKLPPVALETRLASSTWKIYKDIRDDFITWLGGNVNASASQAGVRAMRLAQITSGFLGGIQSETPCRCLGENPECPRCFGMGFEETPQPPKFIGAEKIGLVKRFIEDMLEGDSKLKLIIWCRFRAELERLIATLSRDFPSFEYGAIWGAQKKEEREQAVRLLDPRWAPGKPAIVGGIPGAGGMGLNLTACHTMLYNSNDTKLIARLQSEKRVHRPGQKHKVWYGDVVATGPDGQKTIDHVVIRSLRRKENIASWTAGAWRAAILEE